MDDLVSTEWLAGADDVRIVDASWFLSEHGRDARDEFAAGHIPGAVFFDLDAISDRANPLPHMLPSPETFAAAAGALGIAADDRIVIYDDSPLHSAARAWWMFRTMGARRVALLDGGLAKWRDEGRPLESGTPSPEPTQFAAVPNLSVVRDFAAMRATVEQVVDARSPTRFAGEEPEPRPGVAPGHMPGALNLHYARLFNPDGTWKSTDALRTTLTDAGIDLDRPIATTCGSGVTAAAIVFALHRLGREAALYDGSWAEWGSDPATPKACG